MKGKNEKNAMKNNYGPSDINIYKCERKYKLNKVYIDGASFCLGTFANTCFDPITNSKIDQSAQIVTKRTVIDDSEEIDFNEADLYDYQLAYIIAIKDIIKGINY